MDDRKTNCKEEETTSADDVVNDVVIDDNMAANEGDEPQRPGTKKPYYGLTKLLVMKVALPHVGLLILIILYTIFGAFVFKTLEQDELIRAIDKANKSLITEKSRFIEQIQNIVYQKNGTPEAAHNATQKFVLELHKIFRSNGGRYIRKHLVYSNPWSFDKSLFFGATTLASIGYGNQAPTTRYGRIFCIIFALFGLPLAVIMIADMAKFVSRFIIWCYTNWLVRKSRLQKSLTSWYIRKMSCLNNNVDEDNSDEEQIAEFLWEHLENAKFVEVPAFVMFGLIVIYVTIGALIFMPMESWSFDEGFYFSVISILAIGLGDLTPKNDKYTYVALVYILFGILLATTCVDVVGIQYVNKIHNFGRHLKLKDPLLWLKAVQERRMRRMKSQAMMALFNTVTAVNRMRLDPLEDQAFQRSPVGASPTSNHALPYIDKEYHEAPPSEPVNFKVDVVSVSSVHLKWEPPLKGSKEDLHYSLSYRLSPLSGRPSDLIYTQYSNGPSAAQSNDSIADNNRIRHAPRKTALTVVEPVTDCYFEVLNLLSFSLYHFSLTAINKYGRSGPVYTQEYTEPSSVPLNLRADHITDCSVTVYWDSPVKNKNGERQYIVHYSSTFDRPMDEWDKLSVGPAKYCVASELKPNTRYVFSVAASHNGKLAVFSRSLQIQTKNSSSLKNISAIYDHQTGRINNKIVIVEMDDI